MPRLTKRFVESIPPADKPTFHWDDQMPGFGIKILPTGQRRYLVKYRVGGGRSAQQRWYLLGTHGAITADQARELAQQVLASVARGDDPQATKLSIRTAPTVNELWDKYKIELLYRKKQNTIRHDTRRWREHIQPAIGRKKVIDIILDDIAKIHTSKRDTPYEANRIASLLSKLFSLAEKWGMRQNGSNPCRYVQKFPEESRERYLTEEELNRLGDALRDVFPKNDDLAKKGESPYAVAAIELLLLTGARLNEVLTAQWEWVDLEKHIILLPGSKTGKKTLFLSDAAVNVLKGLQILPTYTGNPNVIQGKVEGKPLVNLTKPWTRICKRAGLKNVRLHDLRHTNASIGVGQGMNLPVLGRLLGHTQASTTNRYAHIDVGVALAAANKIGNIISDALGMNHKE